LGKGQIISAYIIVKYIFLNLSTIYSKKKNRALGESAEELICDAKSG